MKAFENLSTTTSPLTNHHLITSPIRLRALEPDDLEFLYALENDPAVWAVSDTLAPVSRHALRAYLAHATADFHEVRQLRLIVESFDGARAVGVVDLFGFEPLHQRAGAGIIILASARRQGYARHALALLTAHARDVLRLHQLYCTVAAANRASLRLFQAVGFRRVGTRRAWLRGPAPGQWLDAVEFQLVLGPAGRAGAPAPPPAARILLGPGSV